MHFPTSSTIIFLCHAINEYTHSLPFSSCRNLGLYVHIPFCENICCFCPYCKTKYDKELCGRYIDSLIKEIHIAGNQAEGIKETSSLYFGGGTPALTHERIHEIIDALGEHFRITEGIGIELHPDNVNVPVLEALKDAGVAKISIGIPSFNEKYQKILGRKRADPELLAEALSHVKFETVSMDFMFALLGQTFDDMKKDIDTAFLCGANHVAVLRLRY